MKKHSRRPMFDFLEQRIALDGSQQPPAPPPLPTPPPLPPSPGITITGDVVQDPGD